MAKMRYQEENGEAKKRPTSWMVLKGGTLLVLFFNFMLDCFNHDPRAGFECFKDWGECIFDW